MSDPDPRPPVDDLGFNDPEAWGFCDFCAFDVAIIDGVRVRHRRYRNGHDDADCVGSGQPVTMATPLTAKPRQIVSFRRSRDDMTRKSYYQRQRYAARATARRRAAAGMTEVKPKKVTVTSLATGEEVDITDAIIGPVHLDYDPFDLEEDDDGEERDRP